MINIISDIKKFLISFYIIYYSLSSFTLFVLYLSDLLQFSYSINNLIFNSLFNIFATAHSDDLLEILLPLLYLLNNRVEQLLQFLVLLTPDLLVRLRPQIQQVTRWLPVLLLVMLQCFLGHAHVPVSLLFSTGADYVW